MPLSHISSYIHSMLLCCPSSMVPDMYGVVDAGAYRLTVCFVLSPYALTNTLSMPQKRFLFSILGDNVVF